MRHTLIWQFKDIGSQSWPNLFTAVICQCHFPPWVLQGCRYLTRMGADFEVRLNVCVQHVNIFSSSEHVFSSIFLNPPSIILHPMHMSHSCVLRRIICTRTRADRLIMAGDADSFLSGLPVSHARSHSFVCSSLSCIALFIVRCALTNQPPYSVLPLCFHLQWQPHLWQFYCLFQLYSFYLSFAVIGHGLKGDMSSRAAIGHKFDNACTRVHTHTHKG